jgi:5-methylcytosine-specific restriction endonuclease McrA
MCCICGEPCDWTTFNGTYASYPTFEHVVPLKDGGADELHNLGISHRGCNGDRDSDAGSAQDPQGLDPEGAAARPEGIAQ